MSDTEAMDTTSDPPPAEPKEEWGEDISPDKDGKVFKRILVEGTGDDKPGAGDEVYVHYTGRLLDGTVFDSSVEREELFKFKLGEGQVIKGWDTGVATMRRGEKCLLTCSPEYAYGASGSPPKIPPNATLQFEVELFRWRGENVSGDGGVLKSIVTKGMDGSNPNEGATVSVVMKGYCGDKVIDDRELEFSLGEGSEVGVIEGVEMAIVKMKKEEVAKVDISPRYAYGETGNEERGVPPNATLQYTLTLKSFEKAKGSYDYTTIEERIDAAREVKERGTVYFKAGKAALALKLYTRASFLVDNVYTDEDKAKVKDSRVSLHLNMAACSLKLKDAAAALRDCGKVLELDASSVKAHFRKGQAHMINQDYEEAEQCFEKVLELEPENKAAVAQRQACVRKIKEQERRERKLYKNMFTKIANMRDQEEEVEEEERVKVMGGPQGEEPVKDTIAQAADAESESNGLPEAQVVE